MTIAQEHVKRLQEFHQETSGTITTTNFSKLLKLHDSILYEAIESEELYPHEQNLHDNFIEIAHAIHPSKRISNPFKYHIMDKTFVVDLHLYKRPFKTYTQHTICTYLKNMKELHELRIEAEQSIKVSPIKNADSYTHKAKCIIQTPNIIDIIQFNFSKEFIFYPLNRHDSLSLEEAIETCRNSSNQETILLARNPKCYSVFETVAYIAAQRYFDKLHE